MRNSRLAPILALAIITAACGGGAPATTSAVPTGTVAAAATAAPTPPPAPTPTPAPIKLKVAFGNITVDNLNAWLAKESGIFAKNGLDVELVSIDGGSRTMAALLANEVQIAQLGGAECMSAKVGGADLTVAGVLAPVFPYLFMVAKSVKTGADLKGKQVGVSSIGGSADIATRKVLRELGLDPEKDVTIVSLGSHAQRTAALIAGAIQAGVDDPPDTVKLEELGFHSLFDLAGKKLATANTVIVAQNGWLAQNKVAMQRYVDSTVEALAFARKNKAVTVAAMKKYFGSEADRGFDQAYDFFLNEVFPAIPYPRPEMFAEGQAELGKRNTKVLALDVKTILDDSYMKSAADRGVDKR